MKEYVNYIILPEHKLILECCKGPASIEDAINLKRKVLSDPFFNPRFNIIVDFREFEISIDHADIDAIALFVDFLKGLGIKSKVALLTTKPHQVLVTEILKKLSKNLLTIEFETFSTLEAAIMFVGYPMEYFDLIKGKLIELCKSTN